MTDDELTELDCAVARAMGLRYAVDESGCWIVINDAALRWVAPDIPLEQGATRLFQPTRDPGLCAAIAAEKCIEHCWKQLRHGAEWDAVSAYPALFEAASMDECLERFADHPTRIRAWCVAACRAVVSG